MLFPEQRLIVELDGWPTHRELWNFESDGDGDAEALAARHATARVTRERLRKSPEREAARLRRVLAHRATEPRPAGG